MAQMRSTSPEHDEVICVLETPPKGRQRKLHEWLGVQARPPRVADAGTKPSLTTTVSEVKRPSKLERHPSTSSSSTVRSFTSLLSEFRCSSDELPTTTAQATLVGAGVGPSADASVIILSDSEVASTPDTSMIITRRSNGRGVIQSPDHMAIDTGSIEMLDSFSPATLAGLPDRRRKRPNHELELNAMDSGSSTSMGEDAEESDDADIVQQHPRQRRKLQQGRRPKLMLSSDSEEDEEQEARVHVISSESPGDSADELSALSTLSSSLSDHSDYTSDDGDEEGADALACDALGFFNTAEKFGLCDLLAISEKAADSIIANRPYATMDGLHDALHKIRGVSPRLIERYDEMLEGYRAVDELIRACRRLSRSVVKPITSFDEESVKKLRHPTGLAPDICLKPYQIAGVRWLVSLYRNKFGGGILADEMGLGKTAQVIAFLSELLQLGYPGPFLIIVPSSTLDNWLREFKKFCPSINVAAYYGSQKERIHLQSDFTDPDLPALDVIVSTQAAILDEGHFLKNCDSARYRQLMNIKVPFRLLLTGTPLQNNLQELLALLMFILPPEMLHNSETIRRVFRSTNTSRVADDGQTDTISADDDHSISQISKQCIVRARRMLEPFILRRRKIEVLTDFPKKVRHEVICSMSAQQRQLYAKTDRLFRSNSTAAGDSSDTFMSMFMQLRKMACHPLLLRHLYTDELLAKMAQDIMKEECYHDANQQYILEDMSVMSDFELHRLCLEFKSIYSYRLLDDPWMETGKVKQLITIIDKVRAAGERVLVFSQFKLVLDILEQVLATMKLRYLRLDGSTKVETRQQLLDEFTNDEEISVFILSTKAGGFGLNMTAANNVVMYDPDFNPHNERQAEDRAHRVGQTKDVTVYRLISKDTVEEYMLQCAKHKLKLEERVRQTRNSTDLPATQHVSYNAEAEAAAAADSEEAFNEGQFIKSLRSAWLESSMIE